VSEQHQVLSAIALAGQMLLLLVLATLQCRSSYDDSWTHAALDGTPWYMMNSMYMPGGAIVLSGGATAVTMLAVLLTLMTSTTRRSSMWVE
jgi:hypothetical protein